MRIVNSTAEYISSGYISSGSPKALKYTSVAAVANSVASLSYIRQVTRCGSGWTQQLQCCRVRHPAVHPRRRNRRVAEAYTRAIREGKPRTFEDLEAELLRGQKLQGVLTSNEVQEVLRVRGWEVRGAWSSPLSRPCASTLLGGQHMAPLSERCKLLRQQAHTLVLVNNSGPFTAPISSSVGC